MQTYDDALRARLKLLLRDHNQAKLARISGRSRNALTRYLHGAKLPMSFGAALVEELGVSPAWLLRGEEPMYLADVPNAAGEFGGQMMEMLRALDRVAALTPAAAATRPQARVLRELSQHLDQFASLRERINRVTSPVLSELVTQAEQAGHRRELDRANALVKAAYRLQGMCDDRELADRLLSAQAILRAIEQDTEGALRLQMQVFQSHLALDAEFEKVAIPAAGLATVLRGNWYAARALRVARIGLSFASPSDEGSPGWIMLQGQHAMACVELGQFEGVTEAIDHALRFDDSENRPLIEAARTFHDLNAGVYTARDLAGGRPSTFAAVTMILNAAYCSDDKEAIELALTRARELMQAQMPLNRQVINRAERVLAAMRGKGPGPEVPGQSSAATEFGRAVLQSQLFRLAGDKRVASEIHAAQRALETMPDGQSPNPFQVALHVRNVLSGIDANARNAEQKQLREQAEQLRRARITSGFGLLASVAS